MILDHQEGAIGPQRPHYSPRPDRCQPQSAVARDVLAAQRHRPPGERDRVQQLVMVDLAEAGAAILVLRQVAVVLDAEAAHLVGARSDVRDRIDVEVIHHVAGVVVDLDVVVADLAGDLGAGRAGAGLAAVLLDDDQHAVVAGHRAQFLEALDPELAVAALGVAERQHVRHARGRRPA